MSSSNTIQAAVAARLQSWPGFPPALPILARAKSDPRSKAAPSLIDAVEAALSNLGLCIHVFRPVMRKVTQGADFIFVESALQTIRIIEKPQLNRTGFDAEDILDQVQLCLHWSNPGDLLNHPLFIDDPPIFATEDGEAVLIDANFHAVYQLNP